MSKLLLFINVFLIFSTVYSQSFSKLSKISDDQLLIIYAASTTNLEQKTIAKEYLKRAKKEHDTIKIARGYDLLARLFDVEKNLQYADSIIQVSQGIQNHKSYPALGFLLKGCYYYQIDQFTQSLKNFEKAEAYILQDDLDKLLTVKWSKSKIYNQAGISSLENDLETLNLLSTQQSNSEFYNDVLFNINQSLAYQYLELNNIEKAEEFLNSNRDYENQNSDAGYNDLIYIDQGLIAFKKKNPKKALQLYKKVNELNLDPSTQIAYLIDLAETKRVLGDYKGAKKAFKKVDSLYSTHNVFPKELNKAYSFLLCDASQSHNPIDQIYYSEKFITVQKVYTERLEELTRYINAKSKHLANNINDDLLRNSKTFNSWIKNSSIFLVVFIFSVWIYFFGKKNKGSEYLSVFFIKAFLINIFEKPSQSTHVHSKALEKKPVPEINLGLSEERIEEILNKLNAFEKNKEFIKYGKLKDVADYLNTNSTYLSKIVNTYKKCSFGIYIHRLRIEEAVIQLSANTVLRSYTIEAISKEFGYNSAESFSRAFSRVMGLKPSAYLRKINTK